MVTPNDKPKSEFLKGALEWLMAAPPNSAKTFVDIGGDFDGVVLNLSVDDMGKPMVALFRADLSQALAKAELNSGVYGLSKEGLARTFVNMEKNLLKEAEARKEEERAEDEPEMGEM